MKKKSIIVLSLLSLGAFGALAQTAAPAPDPSPFTANVNLTSNYKFRGQDQGTLRTWSPAIQGGFDWTQNGWYVGNWDSNVSFGGNIEMDLYGGYRGEIVKDLGYDVGILEYYYPHKGGFNYNTTEIYGALSWQWLSFKYSHTVSSDYFGIGQAQEAAGASPRPSGRNTGYLDLSANYPVIDKLTLNAHLGYTHLASKLRTATVTTGGVMTSVGLPSFYDYKLGLTYDLGSGFSVAGALVGASKKSFYGDVNKAHPILTLSKTM